jgi:hypothetical protein
MTSLDGILPLLAFGPSLLEIRITLFLDFTSYLLGICLTPLFWDAGFLLSFSTPFIVDQTVQINAVVKSLKTIRVVYI